MRIAYVSLHWPRTHNSGVGKKIRSQVEAWNARGHEARLFMHAALHEPQSELIEADYFFYAKNGKLRTEMNRIHAMKKLIRAIQAFQPDVIYLRYSIYVYPAHRLMAIAPVVEEINTNDLTQHEGLGGMYSLYNRLTRGLLFRLARGFVSVSHELAVSAAFAPFGKPTAVISNGIDLAVIEPILAPNNESPRMFFIATPDYNWHGIDKLLVLARMYPDLIIEIVGYDSIETIRTPPENIRLHGYLELAEYEKVLARADIAISTLALHRKDMQEASPLKTRECLAYGLPLVLAYTDTDLDDLDCDFLLKIPNREDNIETHGPAIRDFAYLMRGERADRRLFAERIDLGSKEIHRLAFLEQVLRNSTDGHI